MKTPRCRGCRSARSKRSSTASTLSKPCTASRSTSACYATISLTGSDGAVSGDERPERNSPHQPREERDAAGQERATQVNERLLTLAETAMVLGCSLDTVKRRVRSGAIPVFRDGRIVRVRESD